MREAKRGCGYRKVGALYLVCSSGIKLACDSLPLKLEPCDSCGFEPAFTRNLQKVHSSYIKQLAFDHHTKIYRENPETSCKCPSVCPICHASFLASFGLMYVGKQHYTPYKFIHEAETMGISKRIAEVPKWLQLNKTWILLAHLKVPSITIEMMSTNGMNKKEPKYIKAIFYAFKPERIEMPVWKNMLSQEQIVQLKKKGVTPIFIEETKENIKKHRNPRDFGRRLDRYLKEEEKD